LSVGTSQLGERDYEILFRDDFAADLTWTTSGSTVNIEDGEYLHIGTGGLNYLPNWGWVPYDDWAENAIHLELSEQHPIVIEQRLKLQSGGRGYYLAGQSLFFEDSSRVHFIAGSGG
jgi:hypothetical protein